VTIRDVISTGVATATPHENNVSTMAVCRKSLSNKEANLHITELLP
jgi:hypothetical protein